MGLSEAGFTVFLTIANMCKVIQSVTDLVANVQSAPVRYCPYQF